MNPTTIARRFEHFRRARKLSTRELARLAGVTPGAVYSAESVGNPTLHNAVRIARVLGVSLDEIVGEERG